MATVEPTAPAVEAHPAPPPVVDTDEEEVSGETMIDRLCNDIIRVRWLGRAVGLAGMELKTDDATAVSELGFVIEELAQEIEEQRGRAWEKLLDERKSRSDPTPKPSLNPALVVLGAQLEKLLRRYIPARQRSYTGDAAATEEADRLAGELDPIATAINALPAIGEWDLRIKALNAVAANVWTLNRPVDELDFDNRATRRMIEAACAVLGIPIDGREAGAVDDGNGEVEDAAGDVGGRHA